MGEAETFPCQGGDENALIIDRHDRIERGALRQLNDCLGGGIWATQIHTQSTISKGARERLPVIGGDDDLCVESRCRIEEVPGAVRLAR